MKIYKEVSNANNYLRTVNKNQKHNNINNIYLMIGISASIRDTYTKDQIDQKEESQNDKLLQIDEKLETADQQLMYLTESLGKLREDQDELNSHNQQVLG